MALADQALLAQDATFIGRVKAALVTVCINIVGEAVSLANLQLHIVRARYAAQILNNINAGSSNPANTFAITVATDSASIAAALAQAGGPLTPTNTPAAAAAIPDSDISTAITNQFNSFLQLA